MSACESQVIPTIRKQEIAGVKYVMLPADMPVNILKVQMELAQRYAEDDISVLPGDELAEILLGARA